MSDYIRIDTDSLDALDPVDAYKAASVLHAQAKALVSAYQDRKAAELAEQHGHRGAARLLGVSQPTLSSRVNRHKERTMRQPADDNEISTYFPGRGVPGRYPLLERIVEKYDLGLEDAHAQIVAYLDQIISIDGQDSVVLGQRPIRPELLEDNPGDVDVHYWTRVDDDTIDFIEYAFEKAAEEDAENA